MLTTVETCVLAGMTLTLAGLGALYLLAAPAIRVGKQAWQAGEIRGPQLRPTSLALIVPLTGDTQQMRFSLESLLLQRDLRYEAYFAVDDETDPAAGLVRALMEHHGHAHLVIAGHAETCCQKNHSLLAGIRSAGEVEILVFCDSSHEALPDFLARLIEPVDSGRAVLATAHRSVLPADGLADVCYFFCALGVQMLQNVRLLTQPWGGATAIRRADFLSHGVDAVWARGVVDDFTMGPYLQGRGVRALAVPEAAMRTRLAPQTWRSWWDWWFRQLLYLKLCMPGTWLLATPAVLGLGGLLSWMWWELLAGRPAGALCIAALATFGAAFGALCQRRLPLWRRVVGFLLMLSLCVPCFLATWGTNTLRWRGVAYVSGLDGRVRRILRGRG